MGATRYVQRTHCHRGHELSGENVWLFFPNGEGGRVERRCKSCSHITRTARLARAAVVEPLVVPALPPKLPPVKLSCRQAVREAGLAIWTWPAEGPYRSAACMS